MRGFTNSIAKFITDRPKTVIAVILLLSSVFLWNLQYFALNAGSNQLVLENDPDVAVYENIRKKFGSDDYVILAFRFQEGTLFNRRNLERTDQLTGEIQSLSEVDSVLSPTSVKLFQNKNISPLQLLSSKAAPSFPTLTGENVNLKRAKEELLNHEVWKNNIIAQNGRVVSILAYLNINEEFEETSRTLNQLHEVLQLEKKLNGEIESDQSKNQLRGKLQRKKKKYELTGKNRNKLQEMYKRLEKQESRYELLRTDKRRRLVNKIREITGKYENNGLKIHLSGLPVINLQLVNFIASDMMLFGIAVSVFVLIVLFILFRKLRWVLLPTGTALLTVLVVLGAMSMLGYRISIVTSNLSSLLFILGFAHSIHYLIRYREGLVIRSEMEDDRRHRWTYRGIIVPCLYTATTTAVGFISLLVADIQPVKVFGLFMSLGVLIAFVFSFTFFPAALALLPEPELEYGLGKKKRNWFEYFAEYCRKKKTWIYSISTILFALSIIGISKIEVEARFVDYFRGSTEINKGLSFIDREVGGTTPLEIVLHGQEKGYFKKEKNLEKLRALRSFFQDMPEAGKVLSLARLYDELQDIGKFIGLPKIPTEKGFNFARQYVSSSILNSYVTDDWSTARFEVRMKETSPTLKRNKVLNNLNKFIKTNEKFQDMNREQIQISGLFKLYTNMLNSLVGSQVRSFGLVLALILAMLMFLFRSLRIAIAGLTPNILPIFVVLGMMGWTGIPLDMVTVMIASVSLGIAIDGTIHYTFRFKDELSRGNSLKEAMDKTHSTVGQAISYTCITIIAGFWVLVLSKFMPSVYFGLLSGLAMFVAMFSTLTFLPVLYQDFPVFKNADSS